MKKTIFLAASVCGLLLSLSASAYVVTGNPNGTITITKFFDYQCPHCRDLESPLNRVIEENPDVKVINRVVPILGKDSWYVARAVIASKKDGKYNEFNSVVMHQSGHISRDDLLRIAQNKMGYNTTQLRKDMFLNDVTDEINANLEAARAENATRIPTLIITNTKGDRRVILGYRNFSDLNKVVAEFRS